MECSELQRLGLDVPIHIILQLHISKQENCVQLSVPAQHVLSHTSIVMIPVHMRVYFNLKIVSTMLVWLSIRPAISTVGPVN